ncbi:MAG: 50S ribosomal protein L4 [Candidatus Saccharibacteria bacterium]|nr:50S ribosomal protein L4 [Candidatus Saccharibacteria bacterium]
MATTLNPAIFDLEVTNHELIKLAYDAYLANSRSSHAKTLKRGEVRGGGKKPWKQKGTGRARFGSTRNPIWRHGGVAFGRTGEENFTKKVSKNAKRLAIMQALSLKKATGVVAIASQFELKEGKSREFLQLLTANQVNPSENTLVVVKTKDELLLRASNNLANVKVIRANYLNVFDLMNADKILIEQTALPVIESWLLGKEEA